MARSNPMRTAPRSAMGPASASGRKRSSRDPYVARHLCLQADQAFDGVGRGDPAPPEQELALEQRAVERAAPEHAWCGRRQLTCVPSLIQFVRQFTPSS